MPKLVVRVIFQRSRRSTLVTGASSLLVALGAITAAVFFLVRGVQVVAALGLLLMAMGLLGLTGRSALKLHAWPPGRLGFFGDRLVLVEGRTEQHMPWDRIEIAILGSGAAWTSGRTSLIRLTDRLTLHLRRWRGSRTVTFRPADFGLDPVSCRDLILRLRDDLPSRSRLPEFDSALDLSGRPAVAGELITPRL